MQKQQTMEIAKRIERINLGDYSLQIDENSEDELSLLDNQIYRTTVKFREQAENSRKDKKTNKPMFVSFKISKTVLS